MSGVGREPLVIVFGRVPRLGEVKTRLARSVGDAEALRVHRALLTRTLQQAGSLAGARVQLAITGDDADGEGAAFAAATGAELVRQCEGDLGARMDNALRAALARSLLPVLVGCDCPVLCAGDLREAFEQLAEADAVFAPAEDGGYALVGASRAITPVFADVPWGTPAVMAATRERLLAARLSWRELRTLWDVDDEAGYWRWRQG